MGNIQQNFPIALDYSTLVTSSRNEILPVKDKYYFSQLALSRSWLSVPNSCRFSVDIYWTNLSPAHVLYFELLTKPTVRLNQIPKYPENFWRGEGNRIAPKCKFLQAYLLLSSSFTLYIFLFFSRPRFLRCVKTWTEYPSFPNFFSLLFSFDRCVTIHRISTSVRVSCNRSNLTHDGFSRRHMDQKRIYIYIYIYIYVYI